MQSLKESFEDVADWCEKHLEDQRGREIGMTFGTMLLAYGQLATLPSRIHGDQRAAEERRLNAKAEEFLMTLSTLFVLARRTEPQWSKMAEPTSMVTNMTYDPGPRPE